LPAAAASWLNGDEAIDFDEADALTPDGFPLSQE
jgi:hypothetical protein